MMKLLNNLKYKTKPVIFNHVFSKVPKYNFSHEPHHTSSHEEELHDFSSSNESDCLNSKPLSNSKLIQVSPEAYVEELLANNRKVPFEASTPLIASLDMFKTKSEHINFLSRIFKEKALLLYPDYRSNINVLKQRILNFDKLNDYQQEVALLDAHMYWKLEEDTKEIRSRYNESLLKGKLYS